MYAKCFEVTQKTNYLDIIENRIVDLIKYEKVLYQKLLDEI